MRRTRTKSTGLTDRNPLTADAEKLMAALQKQYGAGGIMVARTKRQPERTPTGIFSLDLALCGGLFEYAIAGFHGRRSSGKTTAMLKSIAARQRKHPDKVVALVDAELTFDPVWAEKLGVDLDRLLLSQPQSGEEAVDVSQAFMEHDAVCGLFLDSIAALVPLKEIDDSASDQHVGIHAKLVTRLVRKANAAFSQAAREGRPLLMCCANQDRAGIGKWAPPGQEAINLPGGKAYDHYTALQVKFKNKESLKKDDEGFDMLSCNEHAFSIDKNKFNAGMRKGEFILMRAEDEELGLTEGSIDDVSAQLATAKRMGLYTGAGASWTLELPDFKDTLRSKDAWVERIYGDVELHTLLRNHLIAMHASKLGMPDYLVDSIYEHLPYGD